MRFPSKILLFGEYGLVANGSGFAIPWHQFSGQFKNEESYSNPKALDSSQALKQLVRFYTLHQSDFEFLNLKRLNADVEAGIWFDSSIPLGSGLGSSGALVAAIYSQYSRSIPRNLKGIQKQLALLESYFHGSSSGTDPLVSYLDAPIVVEHKGVVEIDEWHADLIGSKMFLVDTQIQSMTNRLVDWFKDQMQKSVFHQRTQTEFLSVNSKLINRILSYSPLDFNDLFIISKYQSECMIPMIPKTFMPHFKYGLQVEDFVFKLCGSGGGGYMLCFAKNEDAAVRYFTQNNLLYLPLT